jgi:orotate phosphoribosyltransferase
VELLRQTGGLRKGHFEYPNGLHTNEYLQVALTMRHYQSAKILSVGLSRLIRANAELRAMIPDLSIVAPATGGLPVAYGMCEALRSHQVYWAERDATAREALPSISRSRPARKFSWWTISFCTGRN